jgi:large subunit ribosomal protein L6
MKIKKLQTAIEIPESVQVSVSGFEVLIKGNKGEVKRNFSNPKVKILAEGNTVKFVSENATKREKTLMNSFAAHVKNMFRGVTEGHLYVLKICSGHFPMNVSLQGKDLSVKNFLGERFPRKIILKEGVTAKIEGDNIKIESCDKEIAAQTAASIEQLTKVRNRDLRVFQDGIWIIIKDGKEIK